jgi:hypothetical protein
VMYFNFHIEGILSFYPQNTNNIITFAGES